MSLLAGRTSVVQLDREKVLGLIQGAASIRSSPLHPPFQLMLPAPPGPAKPARVNLVIRSVNLELETGTNKGRLVLGVEAGVIRLPNQAPVTFTKGELHVAIEFQVFFAHLAAKPVTASLSGVTSAITNFAALANAEVDHLLDDERAGGWIILLGVPGEKAHVVDANTLAVWTNDPSPGAPPVTRSVGAHAVSGALSAAAAPDRFLCHSLVKPAQIDAEWRGGSPTDAEKQHIPGPCGTGQWTIGKDGAQVEIKTLNFTFRDGHIEVRGRFDGNGTCWKIVNGSYYQRLYLDLNPFTRQILPRLEPSVPELTKNVEVTFLCEVLGLVTGILAPQVGSLLLGAGVVIGMNIVADLYKPAIDEQSLQTAALPFSMTGPGTASDPAPRVVWSVFEIHEEGVLVQGDVQTDFYSTSHTPPSLWFDIERRSENREPGRGGETTVRVQPCPPREFEYQDFMHQDIAVLRARQAWLIEPVEYVWKVNGLDLTPLPVSINPQPQSVSFVTTVRTAIPPPNGTEIPGHEVELWYRMAFAEPGSTNDYVTLTPRVEDLNYEVLVELIATDAVGRSRWYTTMLPFKGVAALFGQDYYDHVATCKAQLRDTIAKKVKVKRRIKPGDPVDQLEWDLRYLEEHIAARSPAVGSLVSSLVDAHGLVAIHDALKKRRLQGGT